MPGAGLVLNTSHSCTHGPPSLKAVNQITLGSSCLWPPESKCCVHTHTAAVWGLVSGQGCRGALSWSTPPATSLVFGCKSSTNRQAGQETHRAFSEFHDMAGLAHANGCLMAMQSAMFVLERFAFISCYSPALLFPHPQLQIFTAFLSLQ